MSFDPARFFKLTLDNVYRFACSVLFIAAVTGVFVQFTPIEQLIKLLDWLAIPSAWLVPVADWVAQRDIVVGTVAMLSLIVAIGFAIANDSRSRSGSTALLSITVLMQVGQAGPAFIGISLFLAVLVASTVLGGFLATRFGWGEPEWIQSVWEGLANLGGRMLLAAAAVLSPLGWLISRDVHDARGTRWNPIVIEQIGRPSARIR